eukprot:2687502-Rhodomonas_salina.1
MIVLDTATDYPGPMGAISDCKIEFSRSSIRTCRWNRTLVPCTTGRNSYPWGRNSYPGPQK